MSSHLTITTLGDLIIQQNGEKVTNFPSRKAEALLVYLAVESASSIRRESLFTLLWPGMPEKSARHNLRQVLYALGQTYPEVAAIDGDQSVPLLLADRNTVRINPQAAVEVDLHLLDHNLRETQMHDHLNLGSCESCLDHLKEVVQLYAGDFLHDFYLEDSNEFEDWVEANREAYRQKVMKSLETLANIAIQKENFEIARKYTEHQLALDLLKESAHRQLMEILARSGQRAAALCQYRDCEKILKDEFGVAPSTKTILLHEQIRTESLPVLGPDSSTSDPTSLLETARHNLPHPLTSFIGRQQEIDEITQRVKEHRLVTLTGSGGIGKTQLGLQVGRGLFDFFPEGVWFIELAPLSDPDLVPQTVAYALGLWESPNRPILELMTEYLQDKHCTLILDNCEHVIDAAAQFSEAVLRSCPNVKILASSRESLGVPGEIPYLVPPLSFPTRDQILTLDEWEQHDALRLFAERAQNVLPSYQVTQDNLAPLVQICQQLDGIPLALELAAARVNILPLEQIAARLDDRFGLLTTGSRTAPERQQTLRASIEWSWELLSSEEQELMARLTVFAGGMSLEAVEAVCGGAGIGPNEVLGLLTRLINKSMIIVQRKQGEETRYQMLETIRQYATEKLAESEEQDQIRDRHLEYFRQLGEQADQAWVGPHQAALLDQCEQEMDNIRIALNWAIETDVEAGLRLITALSWFFDCRGYLREGKLSLEQLLAQADSVEPTIKARALHLSGGFNQSMYNLARARALYEESLALYRELGNQQGIVNNLYLLLILSPDQVELQKQLLESLDNFRKVGNKLMVADVLAMLGNHEGKNNFEQAMIYLKESEALYRKLGHLVEVVEVLNISGRLAIWQGDFISARPMLEESLTIQETLGMRRINVSLTNLGILYFRLGNYRKAQDRLEKSISISERSGDMYLRSLSLAHLGYVFLRMGEINQARKNFDRSQRQFNEAGNIFGVFFSLEGLASLAVTQGQAEKAARLFGWSDTARQEIQDIRPPVEQADVDQDIATIIEMIGEEAYVTAYAEGQKMTNEEAIAYSMTDG